MKGSRQTREGVTGRGPFPRAWSVPTPKAAPRSARRQAHRRRAPTRSPWCSRSGRATATIDASGDHRARAAGPLHTGRHTPYGRLRPGTSATTRGCSAGSARSRHVGRDRAADRPAGGRVPQGGDPQLAALYFQFGRYLLISSLPPGQPAGQPAGHLERPDRARRGTRKYTININTEMNYWPAGPTNLAGVLRPAVRPDRRARRVRRATARAHVRRARLGRPPQHGRLARHRAGRRRVLGHLADRRRLALRCLLGALPITPAT